MAEGEQSRLEGVAYVIAGLGMLGVLFATAASGNQIRGRVALTEGQHFSGHPSEYLSFDEVTVSDPGLPPVQFRLESVDASFQGLGEPLWLRAELALENGLKVTAERGKSFELGEVEIELGRVGIAACFTIRHGNREVAQPFCANLDAWTPDQEVETFIAGPKSETVYARLFPDYVPTPEGPASRSMELANPKLQLWLEPEEGRAPQKSLLGPNQALPLRAGVRLQLLELRKWALFQITQDKSFPWMTLALFVLGLGLLLQLLSRIREWRDAPEKPSPSPPAPRVPPPKEATVLVFISSFLLFVVQPLVGRLVLPEMGGGFQVWTTSLMFFQGLLFLGYVYCAVLGHRIGRYHLAVVLVPILVLPLGVNLSPQPDAPVTSLLLALATGVAAPVAVLATTSVIAQRWVAQSQNTRCDNPFPLYAASNAGALLGLLAYPILIEPTLSLATQRLVWSIGYGLFAIAALLAFRKLNPATVKASAPSAEPPPGTRLLATWFLLAAAPSALLLSVTNVITQDLGSAPLLWVVPLAIYLGSFIIAFHEPDRSPRLLRRFWVEIAFIAILYHGVGISPKFTLVVLGMYLLILLAVTLAAHRELYRRRPHPDHLERFYLTIAAGGWFGGALVSLGAPLAFDWTAEFPLAIVAALAAVLLSRRGDVREWLKKEPKLLLLASAALIIFAITASTARVRIIESRYKTTHRNFYGIYRVMEFEGLRSLLHGTTTHGRQPLSPEERSEPVSYYHRSSPLGDIMSVAPRPRKVGAVGLGVGATAAYLGTGEEITFFELDPDLVDLARQYFTYLQDATCTVKTVVGDGRMSLERDDIPDGAYSVLLIDAFSSDAIPVHLLTREALELYARKLAPGGYLLFHTSSRYQALNPVILATGATLGLAGAEKERNYFRSKYEEPNSYVLLVRDPAQLPPLVPHGWRLGDPEELSAVRPWTDDRVDFIGPLLEKARRKRR